MKKTEPTKSDLRDRAIMMNLAENFGFATEKHLDAAGISRDSQARNAPYVAEQMKLRGMQIAA